MIESHDFDVNELDADGNTLLHVCLKRNMYGFFLYWIQHAKSDKTLVNHKNAKGDTSLHVACKNGSIEIAKLLVEKHAADATIRNNDGKLPIDLLLAHVATLVLPFPLPYTLLGNAPVASSKKRKQEDADIKDSKKNTKKRKSN